MTTITRTPAKRMSQPSLAALASVLALLVGGAIGVGLAGVGAAVSGAGDSSAVTPAAGVPASP